MSETTGSKKLVEKKGIMHNYGLSITLAGMFVASWVAQAVFQWQELLQAAEQHGQTLTWAGYWPAFLSATFENWQSEFVQLLVFVVLTSRLYHKGSHESKDTDEEMNEALHRIEQRLEKLGGKIDDPQDREEWRKMEESIQKQRRMRCA